MTSFARVSRFTWLLFGGVASGACSSSSVPMFAEPKDATAPGVDGPCGSTVFASDAMASGPSNNSAELVGASFGDGTDPNDALIKVIRADQLQPEPRLTLGSVHAMRAGSDTFVNLAVPVTNVSQSNLCFIELEGLRLKDASGALLVQPQVGPFIDGSVLVVDATLWTSSCVLPGETGWVVDIESADAVADLYGALDSVEFRITAVPFPADALPPPRVLPYRYDVASDGIVTVCFANLGTGPAEMTAQAFSLYLALDDQGNPLDWDFLTTRVQPIGLLQPAQPGSASTRHRSFFAGTARRMRPFIDFESPGAMSELPSHARGPAEAWRRGRDRLALGAAMR